MDLDAMAEALLQIIKLLPRGAPFQEAQVVVKGEAFLLDYLLMQDGTASPGAMSRAMGASTARISAALNGMERKGWVVRGQDPGDHRKTVVALTPAGQTLARQHRRQLVGSIRAMLSALGEEDAREYIRIMDRILHIMLGVAGQQAEARHIAKGMDVKNE